MMYETGDQVRIIREPDLYTVVTSGNSGVCIIQLGKGAGPQRIVYEYTLELVAKAEKPSLRRFHGKPGTATDDLSHHE
jgi:hypothetical protein